jgi:hypothetical protein
VRWGKNQQRGAVERAVAGASGRFEFFFLKSGRFELLLRTPVFNAKALARNGVVNRDVVAEGSRDVAGVCTEPKKIKTKDLLLPGIEPETFSV